MKRVLELREPGPRTAEAMRLGAALTTVVFLVTALLVLAGAVAAGRGTWGYDVLVVCTTGLWVANVLEALPRWRTRAVYLTFHLSLLLFVVANPLIELAYHEVVLNREETVGAPRVLWCLIISLLMLRAGAWWATRRITAAEARLDHGGERLPRPLGRVAQRLLMAAALAATACVGGQALDAWLYVQQHSYSAYFTAYQPRLPVPVVLGAAMAPAFLACYLATFPRSRTWLAVLALHLAATAPLLAMGLRGPFMRAAALAVTYAFIRWRYLGRRDGLRIPVAALVTLALLVPVAMAGLGELRYQRVGQTRASEMDPVTDFVYSQSITFSVAARGVYAQEALPGPRPTMFTVGNIVDYLLYGAPGQMLLGTKPLEGNSLRHAEQGHEFAHSFSYFAYRADYLRGLGSGSSYLVETYLDGSFALVALFSLVLGWWLVLLVAGHSRRWLPSVVLLAALSGTFTLPRDNATAFLVFLFMPPFWAAVAACGAVVWWDRRRGGGATER